MLVSPKSSPCNGTESLTHKFYKSHQEKPHKLSAKIIKTKDKGEKDLPNLSGSANSKNQGVLNTFSKADTTGNVVPNLKTHSEGHSKENKYLNKMEIDGKQNNRDNTLSSRLDKGYQLTIKHTNEQTNEFITKKTQDEQNFHHTGIGKSNLESNTCSSIKTTNVDSTPMLEASTNAFDLKHNKKKKTQTILHQNEGDHIFNSGGGNDSEQIAVDCQKSIVAATDATNTLVFDRKDSSLKCIEGRKKTLTESIENENVCKSSVFLHSDVNAITEMTTEGNILGNSQRNKDTKEKASVAITVTVHSDNCENAIAKKNVDNINSKHIQEHKNRCQANTNQNTNDCKPVTIGMLNKESVCHDKMLSIEDKKNTSEMGQNKGYLKHPKIPKRNKNGRFVATRVTRANSVNWDQTVEKRKITPDGGYYIGEKRPHGHKTGILLEDVDFNHCANSKMTAIETSSLMRTTKALNQEGKRKKMESNKGANGPSTNYPNDTELMSVIIISSDEEVLPTKSDQNGNKEGISMKRRYKCSWCYARFMTKGEMIVHHQSNRHPQPVYHCQICDCTIKCITNFRHHLRGKKHAAACQKQRVMADPEENSSIDEEEFEQKIRTNNQRLYDEFPEFAGILGPLDKYGNQDICQILQNFDSHSVIELGEFIFLVSFLIYMDSGGGSVF
ncbi:hypothetical protein ScPMuIL_000851 [Solemya velum]